jgi:hypothetical protein
MKAKKRARREPVTILSLFCGRWQTLEPFLYGLAHLDWPKSEMRLLWYTNAPEMFARNLISIAEAKRKEGYDVTVVWDESLPPSGLSYRDGVTDVSNHPNTIAAIYNAAWAHVKTARVLFLEDDVVAPSFTLKRFSRILAEHKSAAMANCMIIDRHGGSSELGLWDVAEEMLCTDGEIKTLRNVGRPRITYGTRRVAAGGFCAALVDRSRLPRSLQATAPFKAHVKWGGWAPIAGCDKIFGLEITNDGGEVYADYEVRPLHIDSTGTPH